jgi:hypothetical protein
VEIFLALLIGASAIVESAVAQSAAADPKTQKLRKKATPSGVVYGLGRGRLPDKGFADSNWPAGQRNSCASGAGGFRQQNRHYRGFNVRALATANEAVGCHILFVSRSRR